MTPAGVVVGKNGKNATIHNLASLKMFTLSVYTE